MRLISAIGLILCYGSLALAMSGASEMTSQAEVARNDWVSPYFVLTYHHGKCAGEAQEAIALINRNATITGAAGPWTVINKRTMSADGDPRAYVSWAPYWWPDCCEDQQQRQNGNGSATDESAKRGGGLSTTETQTERKRDLGEKTFSSSASTGGIDVSGQHEALEKSFVVQRESTTKQTANSTAVAAADAKPTTEEEPPCVPRPSGYMADPSLIWSTCPYVNIDGQRNPDLVQLNGAQNFVRMSRSALLNAITFGLTHDETFSHKAVELIRAFFLDPRTGVRPEIKYGQVVRGPPGGKGKYAANDYSVGTFRGVIEWRYILVVVNAIVILRSAGCKAWSALDAAQMSKWATDYLHWLETSDLGLDAKSRKNNFVTFYYNQIVALYILLGKTDEASRQVNAYFTGPFLDQIDSKGDQPMESSRTRSLHYLAFGLQAMVANAKLADNLGLNMWTAKTGNGTTIRDGIDFALQRAYDSLANSTGPPSQAFLSELWAFAPTVSTALTVYGDHTDGRYKAYLANNTLTGDAEEIHTWRFFNLPCSFYSTPLKGHNVSSQTFT